MHKGKFSLVVPNLLSSCWSKSTSFTLLSLTLDIILSLKIFVICFKKKTWELIILICISWIELVNLICLSPFYFFLCKFHLPFAHFSTFLYLSHFLLTYKKFSCVIDLDILPKKKKDLHSENIKSWSNQLSQFSLSSAKSRGLRSICLDQYDLC